MTREEDLIRSTTQAIASTVHDVAPLRLEPADERSAPARVLRRPPSARRLRGARWPSWAAPLTAALVVVALAVGLVSVRGVLSADHAAPGPATSGPGVIPRYYVALQQDGVVVGDSVTGATIATFKAPARTTFRSVTAAADDRTFVIFAVTTASGSASSSLTAKPTLTGSWYEVRLASGTAHRARLSRLPVPSSSWTTGLDEHGNAVPGAGQVFTSAVSASGQELAVAAIPPVHSNKPALAQDWQEIKVFSLASGRLLHNWIEHDPAAAFGSTPGTSPGLTWIDGDQALDFVTAHQISDKVTTATIRRLDISGSVPGDLAADSTVTWLGNLTYGDERGCFAVDYWPPVTSADGKTISCPNLKALSSPRYRIDFDTVPVPGTGTTITPRLDYRVTSPEQPLANGKAPIIGAASSVLWVSASGSALIGEWSFVGDSPPLTTPHFGVISQDKFTPLKVPASLEKLAPFQIAW